MKKALIIGGIVVGVVVVGLIIIGKVANASTPGNKKGLSNEAPVNLNPTSTTNSIREKVSSIATKALGSIGVKPPPVTKTLQLGTSVPTPPAVQGDPKYATKSRSIATARKNAYGS